MRVSRLFIVSCLLVLSLITGGSLASQDEQSFGDRTDVVLIEIPVHVSIKGRPVRGLTAKNFEILEGKKKQKIVALDVFDLSLLDPTDLSSGLGVPAASRRNFLFLFDLSNTLPAGVVRAQEAAIEMVAGALHPSDVAGVATYSQSKGMELVLGFSPDRAQIIAALESLGVVDPFERINDPLKLTIAAIESAITESLAEGAGEEEGPGVRPDANAILLEALKDQQTLVNRVGRDLIKDQITDFSSALDELAQILDSISGRKQIVLFTQGFDSEIVFGTQDAQRLQEITEAVHYGQVWRVDSEERFGAGDAQITLLNMLENFRRSDCAVHTVDTGGLRAAGNITVATAERSNLSRGHDGLFMIANQTGGQFYRNINDLSEAMDDLLDRTSITYVLTIQPKAEQMDGEYHPIRVQLKNAPKGASISHRPGYFARRAYRELKPSERQMSTAEMLLGGAAGGLIHTNVLAAAFRTADERAYVLTAIEIDGSSLMRGQGSNVVPAEVYTYAFDSEGRVRDFFTQAIGLDLYKVGYRMRSGFKLISYLRLAPGRYEVRTLIRNAETGATGLVITPLEVPDFHDALPDLLPPFFIEAADRWLVGEGERESEDDFDYPLIAGGDRLIPASRPVLPVGQQVPVLLVGHRLPKALEAHASFRAVGSKGAAYEVEVTLGARHSDLSGAERITAHLRPGAMPAGDYELLLTLSAVDGAESVTSAIPVSVIDTW